MTSLKSLIITLFVLIYTIVVFSQQNELEFYITFTKCPNGVGSSNNITTTIGECTLIENCGTYKSIKTVEKFTNNYESRVFNNNNCKGVFSKKTIWFECVPGGEYAEGSVVYCSQYGIDMNLQFSSSSTTTSKQTTTITTSGPSSTVVSSGGNTFSTSGSSSSGGISTGFPFSITSGSDKNLQISSTPSTTSSSSSTTTSKQTTTITTSGPSSTVVSSSGNSFSSSSSSSSSSDISTGFPFSITSGSDKNLQISSTPSTTSSTTTSKQTTTITTSGPSSTVVSSSGNSFSSSSSSSSSTGFPSSITSGSGGSNFPFGTGLPSGLLGGNKNQIKFN
ncbi:hypothetical protein ACTFIT_009967 [Dictyostelium discoideum]